MGQAISAAALTPLWKKIKSLAQGFSLALGSIVSSGVGATAYLSLSRLVDVECLALVPWHPVIEDWDDQPTCSISSDKLACGQGAGQARLHAVVLPQPCSLLWSGGLTLKLSLESQNQSLASGKPEA